MKFFLLEVLVTFLFLCSTPSVLFLSLSLSVLLSPKASSSSPKRNRPSLKHTFPPRIPFHFHSEQPTSTSPAESQGNPTRISSLGTFSLTPLRYFHSHPLSLFFSLSPCTSLSSLYFFHPSYEILSSTLEENDRMIDVIDFSFLVLFFISSLLIFKEKMI